jgi:hypothetical protein
MSNGITVVDSFTTTNQINSYLNTLSEKYLADNEYILSGTNSGVVSSSVVAIAPYANLSNRYFPSVATLPYNDGIKTIGQLGGYFIPSNLGASTYLTKNITYSLNTTQVQNGAVYKYIDPSKYNKGRGLTQKDQDNIVEHTIDINWIKSTNTSDYYDGNIINTDTYQKFIPYQSAFETIKSDSNGVINAKYDFEFFTGDQKQTWFVTNSATQLNQLGYFDLNARIENLLYTPGSALYSWQTDVFGNQYALYKTQSSPRSLYQDLNAVGKLWVKTLDGIISQSTSALNLIYNSYKNDTITYSQLSANNIINFELFFDTFVIQLSNKVLYEKITFDYNTYQISNSLQNFLPLELGITSSSPISTLGFNTSIGTLNSTAQVFYGGNWYDSNSKTIIICTVLSATFSGKTGSIIDNTVFVNPPQYLTDNLGNLITDNKGNYIECVQAEQYLCNELGNDITDLNNVPIQVINVNTNGLSSVIIPVLYKLDLNNPRERIKIYPTNSTASQEYIEYVYPANNVTYMENPVFCYNEDTNKYITTFVSFFANSNKLNIINYKVTPN